MAIEVVGFINNSLFTKGIMQAKKPLEFTVPKFIKFEWKIDPVEHIY